MGKPKGRFLGLNALALQNPPNDNDTKEASNITSTPVATPEATSTTNATHPATLPANPPPPNHSQATATLPAPTTKTTTGRRAKGLQPVPGGRARNPDYVTVTLYINPKLRKLLRFYLADHEDLSEITEKFLEDFVAARQAKEAPATALFKR